MTNIGRRFEYWANYDSQYERERLTVRDEEEEITTEGNRHEHRLTLEIEAIALTEDPLTTGCNLLSDIYKAVGSSTDWGGHAIDTQLVRNEKAIATEGRTAVRVMVEVEVMYRTGLWEQ